MAKTRAQANRELRQEALRDQLAEQCRVQHILENIKKLEELHIDLNPNEINRLKAANDQRIKLLSKYLPDLKAIEHSGQIDSSVSIVDQIKAAHAASAKEQQ